MISTANSTCFQPEWFNLKGDGPIPYAVVKSEYQDLMNEIIRENQKRAEESYSSLTERVNQGRTKVKLTEDQKRYLSEHFDPSSATLLEYQSFIDKLCEFGILDEEDKHYVGYGVAGCSLDMTPLSYVRCGAQLTPGSQYNPMSYSEAFSSSRGNVTGWVQYLSTLTAWDQKSNSWQKKPEAVLFGRIKDVLEAISA